MRPRFSLFFCVRQCVLSTSHTVSVIAQFDRLLINERTKTCITHHSTTLFSGCVLVHRNRLLYATRCWLVNGPISRQQLAEFAAAAVLVTLQRLGYLQLLVEQLLALHNTCHAKSRTRLRVEEAVVWHSVRGAHGTAAQWGTTGGLPESSQRSAPCRKRRSGHRGASRAASRRALR